MTQYQSYIDGRKERARRERQALEAGVREKRELAERLADLLVASYGATKVCLIGSLARGDGLHRSSDIDLVVEGLPAARYFEALAELWRMLPPGVEVDLVPLEDASSEMLEVVKSEGIPLHG